jgi:hypothetical protein
MQLYNANNQYITVGPVSDTFTGAVVNDLTITASLYTGRDMTDPATTPGTLVAGFGTNGSIAVPYAANRDHGIYQAVVPAFNIALGNGYVMVVSSPVSPSGYQLSRQYAVTVSAI